MKVLIVDDIPMMLRSLDIMMSRNGFDTQTASNGEEALHCLIADPTIGIVVTDLVMHPMNGVELYRQAQIVERLNDEGPVDCPPFVFITACVKSGARDVWESELRFAERNFVAVVHKPVSEHELIPILRSIRQPDLATS